MSIVTGQTFYSWKNFSQNAQPGTVYSSGGNKYLVLTKLDLGSEEAAYLEGVKLENLNLGSSGPFTIKSPNIFATDA